MTFTTDVWWDGFILGAETVAAIGLMATGFVAAFRAEEWQDAISALLIFIGGAGLAWLVLSR